MTLDVYYDIVANHQLTKDKSTYHRKGLCGLVNLGNKCFLNSTLQCLSHTLKLTDYFLSNKHTEDDPLNINKRKKEYYLVMSYIHLLSNIWETNQLIKPKSFVENLSKFIPKYFTLQQQDAHECLMYILDILHKGLCYEIEVEIEGIVKTKEDLIMQKSLQAWKSFHEKEYSVITQTFNGMLYNTVVCSTCKNQDDVFEPFNVMSLDIPNDNGTHNLQDCLSSTFLHTEAIQSWVCEKCKGNGCERGSSLWSLPDYYILHLKRFGDKPNTGKINTHINFPIDDLNLTQYVSKDKGDPNNYIYALYAVNYHSGSEDSGHYWSCCRNVDGNWYMFNDGHVSKFHNVTDLVSKDAYMLFYYRKYINRPIQI